MPLIKKGLPLIIFAIILILLSRALFLHPTEIPSPLINKPAPPLHLPDLFHPKKFITSQDFLGHITLLNVWATWCIACQEEHDVLLALAQQEKVIFYGLNYKDDPIAAKKWLKNYGNPYQRVGEDTSGNAAIDWGVYGSPETFIIDQQGIIRYKHVGPLTEEIWNNQLKPVIEKLGSESK